MESCGDVGYKGGVEQTQNADWANINLHEYRNTENGNICSLSSDDIAPIRDYFEEADNLVFYDLDTVMLGTSKENMEDISSVGRCCCDKMPSHPSINLTTMVSATSGRCRLNNLGDLDQRCGRASADWAMESMHHYKKVVGSKCTLTKEELAPVEAKFNFKAEDVVAPEANEKEALIDVHVALMNSKTFQLDQDRMVADTRWRRLQKSCQAMTSRDPQGYSRGSPWASPLGIHLVRPGVPPG